MIIVLVDNYVDYVGYVDYVDIVLHCIQCILFFACRISTYIIL